MTDPYRMTRRDKIIVCVAVGAMWFASSAYQAYLRWDLETTRMEAKAQADQDQLKYLQELTKTLSATNQ